MSQFAGAGGKLSALVLTAAVYALAGAIAGPIVALIAATLYRFAYLGQLHRWVRAAPYRAMALAIAAPIPPLAVGLALIAATDALEGRKHFGLVIASAMIAAVLAVIGGALIALLIARAAEIALEAAGVVILSRWWPPLVVLVVYLGAGIALINASAGETLGLLGLRPAAVALLALALAAPMWRRTGDLPLRLGRLRPGLRSVVVSAPLVALIAVVVASGSRAPARKAAVAHTGLAGPLVALLRTAADLDRDGYSPILGGGDCDDWNPDVHPGAPEIPDDGVDNNCVGGDATTARDPASARFGTPPPMPDDWVAVLITIDTLRADHLGAYGYERPTSPNLDRLAADGTVFANAWAHAPSTRYSIPAILTGRLPLEVDYFPLKGQWPGVARSNTTIAEVMKQRGFTTGAILNYWYFEERRAMDQGFDHYDNENRRLHRGVAGEGPASTRGSSSRQQTDKAIAYIDEHAGERFFLWVHYYDPHYQYERQPGTPDFGGGKRGLYDAEIHFTDKHVGRLLDHLRRRGLYDRAVVAVTGDHGEGFGEHGVDLHGYHLYAAQTRVPLILKVPGATAERVRTPVGHVDLLPTLANLAGAGPSAEMDGVSLVPYLTGERGPDEDRVVFQQLSFENENEMRAAASARCHVIFNVSPHLSWEVYAIDRDPGETRDISESPGDCAAVRRELERFHDSSEIPEGAAEALLETRPPIDKPVDVDFGDEARLLAVELPDGPVARGGEFPVTLIWEARGRVRDPWKVFVHFDGPGPSFFQADHIPARPLPWWRPGQLIRYTRQVTVPPRTRPGAHQVWVGLFAGDRRYPARSNVVRVSERRAAVGEVVVKQAPPGGAASPGGPEQR
jgi:arylsulfatase A-like enzyme